MASNIAVAHAWNLILEKFQMVQKLTDDGLFKKLKPDKTYEAKLIEVEKQFGRLKTGLDRLDIAEDVTELKAVADRWIEIWEIDLPKAQGEWARAYINAVFEAAALPDSREEV
jgi:hypothetical protein